MEGGKHTNMIKERKEKTIYTLASLTGHVLDPK